MTAQVQADAPTELPSEAGERARTPPSAGSLDRISGLTLLVGSLVLLGLLVRNHLQMILSRVPLDFYEASMPAITAVWAAGMNPHVAEMQPEHTNVYPPLYNILVAPLTLVFGNTLELHRVVVALFIAGTLAVCFVATRRATGSRVLGLAGAVLLYSALLAYNNPVAHPNGLGMFLFVAAVAVPWLYGFSDRSLAASLALGLLSFFGKPYFLLSIGYVFLFVLFTVSIRKALVFGLAATASAAALAVAIHVTLPFFFENTVFGMRNAALIFLLTERMTDQMGVYAQVNAAFLVLMGGVLAHRAWREPRSFLPGRRDAARPWVNLRALDRPLVNVDINYFWLCFTGSLVVIVVLLGRHTGAFMTYPLQLMSPFLIIAGLASVARSALPRWIAVPLLLAALVQAYYVLPKDLEPRMAGWERLESLFEGAQDVYVTPLAMLEVVERDLEVYHNGHTGYFPLAAMGRGMPDFLARPGDETSVEAVWTRYVDRIHGMIESQAFDFILLDMWTNLPFNFLRPDDAVDPMALLEANYRRTEEIPVALHDRPAGGVYYLRVWRPIDRP